MGSSAVLRIRPPVADAENNWAFLNQPFSVFVNTLAISNTLGWIGDGARERQCKAGVLMRRLFSKFLDDQSGATAIEYCLIAAGLSIVIITAVNGIGTTLSDKFTSVNSSLK
jgi:pilus assembly protein Flp/PilA